MKLGAQVISLFSGEWMLTRGRPNGGDVVVFRTLWVGSILLTALAFIKAGGQMPFGACAWLVGTWQAILTMMKAPDGPVLFGAVYLALYARFTSQWTYMANLYNQIKQAEVTMQSVAPSQFPGTLTAHAAQNGPAVPASSNLQALAEWKAGFIEDALAVHMATKPTIAGVIRAWYRDPAVKEAFDAYTDNPQAKIGWLISYKVLP
jgi:hypothetical protein